MGNEKRCAARVAGKRDAGKALLETNELIFRGAECRAKILFRDIQGVTASRGLLRIRTKNAEFAFALGAAAEKWREKILHPNKRAEKLGVKAGMRVAVAGDAESGFLKELRKSKAEIVPEGAGGAELTFCFVNGGGALGRAGALAKKLAGAAGLWIVYPKGQKEIAEHDVLRAGRRWGLKDVKVVGFSAKHTALKFVIPLKER